MMSGKDSTDHRDVFTTGIVKLGSFKDSRDVDAPFSPVIR